MAKDFTHGYQLYHHVFGCMKKPKYLIRGVGDLGTTRIIDYNKTIELYD